MEELNSVINMLNEHKICQLQKHNETLKELQEHSEKLNELKELKKNKEKPNVTEVGDNIERDILVKNAKDIDKLVGYAGMTKFEELKQLICDMCHHELVLGEKSETHKNKGHGVFHYDFQLHGSDFNGKSQAREFINLKSHIANHLMSKKHRASEDILEKNNKELARLETINHSIGMSRGRRIYSNVKNKASLVKYEEDCVVEYRNGEDTSFQIHKRLHI